MNLKNNSTVRNIISKFFRKGDDIDGDKIFIPEKADQILFRDLEKSCIKEKISISKMESSNIQDIRNLIDNPLEMKLLENFVHLEE